MPPVGGAVYNVSIIHPKLQDDITYKHSHTHLHCKFSEGNLQKRAVHNQLASECSMLLIRMQIKTLKVSTSD